MDKYVIRETSISNKPPMTGMYFAGFLPGGRGATMVFGKEHAQKYDTLEAVVRIVVQVKELSGRNTWRWELANPDHGWEANKSSDNFKCKTCGVHIFNHGDTPDERQ